LDECEAIGGKPVVARRDPTTLFDLIGEPLDSVAAAVEIWTSPACHGRPLASSDFAEPSARYSMPRRFHRAVAEWRARLSDSSQVPAVWWRPDSIRGDGRSADPSGDARSRNRPFGAGLALRVGLAVLHDPIATRTPQSPGTWHWSGAYEHSWFVDPFRRITVVALTNTAITGMIGAYPDSIRDAVYALS
jgi:CubicO group peptidase (beta-lactamase class C family)